MGKILPVLLALIGLAGGVGAGLMLRPEPEPVDIQEGEGGQPPAEAAPEPGAKQGEGAAEDAATSDFVKMNNQFVVPIVDDGRVSALVVLSLSLEMTPGGSEIFYQREPKLRDAFLEALFEHANSGGFDGVFTEGYKLDALRAALLETATMVMGPVVKKVLVTDLLRQDM